MFFFRCVDHKITKYKIISSYGSENHEHFTGPGGSNFIVWEALVFGTVKPNLSYPPPLRAGLLKPGKPDAMYFIPKSVFFESKYQTLTGGTGDQKAWGGGDFKILKFGLFAKCAAAGAGENAVRIGIAPEGEKIWKLCFFLLFSYIPTTVFQRKSSNDEMKKHRSLAPKVVP